LHSVVFNLAIPLLLLLLLLQLELFVDLSLLLTHPLHPSQTTTTTTTGRKHTKNGRKKLIFFLNILAHCIREAPEWSE
jgi:hypothetical protein